ncbi:hypothetical protein [Mycobacterium conspicuum]|uniref:Uncharacterized protein n=1 Tax=Mycobacterium conspicuum TaxID=44010 RepID=A0A7I7Y897_9MYCO|nr:hypothetical protein [Mycobacterium conspicuum]BBZ37925.1 hypothetical protein MCNS_09880 [Mycobacterium conspicuum]
MISRNAFDVAVAAAHPAHAAAAMPAAAGKHHAAAAATDAFVDRGYL